MEHQKEPITTQQAWAELRLMLRLFGSIMWAAVCRARHEMILHSTNRIIRRAIRRNLTAAMMAGVYDLRIAALEKRMEAISNSTPEPVTQPTMVSRHRAEMDAAMRERRAWFLVFLFFAVVALLIAIYGKGYLHG